MSLVSVIIPTLDEATLLDRTLEQFDRLPGEWEIIVADSGSIDSTQAIARSRGVRLVEGPRGRGLGMNAGATVATGDILLFLHADTLLPQDAHQRITEALANPAVAATGFHLTMDGPGWRYRLVPYISSIRMRVQRTFFGDQAIAVRRADFERVGGYSEPHLMEDVALSRRLRREGKFRVLGAYVVTSSRRFEQGGMIRTLVLMTCMQAAYSLGVSADRLAKIYRLVR